MKAQKGHPEQNFTDMSSIGLIQSILGSHGRVMPDLKVIDKWPLIDGRVEVQDDKNQLVGRMNVQAKTLPKDHKYKFPCPVDFLSGCKIEPSLLFGIDNENNRIYWLYFDIDEVEKIDFESNTTTKTISFDQDKYIDKDHKEYIEEWILIVEANNRRYREYNKLEKAYLLLQESENNDIGISDVRFIQVHKFLDRVNWLLDNPFKVVKDISYPGSWKLGIALYHYSEKEITYTLYPVKLDINDVLIKEVDKNLHGKIEKEGLGFTSHFRDNPIYDDPEAYANKYVFDKLEKLIKSRNLKDSLSKFLISEYIFDFVDKFYLQFGIKQSEELIIDQVAFGFYVYFPIWLEESLKFLVSINRNGIIERLNSGRMKVIEPDSLMGEIMLDEREVIKKTIAERIERNELGKDAIPVGSVYYSFKRFKEFLDYLKLNKVGSVKRVYKQKDWNRLTKLKSNYLFNTLSLDDAKENIKIFFENIEDVFDGLVLSNFPKIKNKLPFWYGVDKVLIHLELQETYSGLEHPGIEYIFLKKVISEESSSQKVQFIDDINEWETLRKEISAIGIDDIIQFQGKKYTINPSPSSRSSAIDFIYHENPMLNYIYEYLEDILTEEFFRKID